MGCQRGKVQLGISLAVPSSLCVFLAGPLNDPLVPNKLSTPRVSDLASLLTVKRQSLLGVASGLLGASVVSLKRQRPQFSAKSSDPQVACTMADRSFTSGKH